MTIGALWHVKKIIIQKTIHQFNYFNMGFNILGIAIDQKIEDKITLCRELQIGEITLEEENAVFEDASSSYSMDEEAVYFTETETGTLITLGTSIDFTTIKLRPNSAGRKVLLFVMGDTVGMYILFLAENGEIIRYLNHNQGQKIAERGTPLEIEKVTSDVSETILALIEAVIGKSFWDIEPDARSLRFKRGTEAL